MGGVAARSATAELVLGVGIAHSPMVVAENWGDMVRNGDAMGDGKLFDVDGQGFTHAELEQRNGTRYATRARADVWAEQYRTVRSAVAELRHAFHEAEIDTVIVAGDDQFELLDRSNYPTFLVFTGSSFRMLPMARSELRRRARRHADAQVREHARDHIAKGYSMDAAREADEGCEPALASSVQEQLARADVRIGNLEGALADPSVELSFKRGWFDCEPEMLGAVAPHFDAFACANNVHFGAAIETSIGHLDRAGIPHAGAGATLAEARHPAILERDGRRIGLLAFTSVFWPDGHAATESRPGVATIGVATAYEPHWRVHEMPGGPATVRTIPDPGELAAALDAIRLLRANVDVAVVYFHWGVSLSEEVAEYQQQVGRAAVEAGADVVVGSHPHVVQGVELWMERPIFYSVGNFMFGWRLHREATRDGVLVHVSAGGAHPWRCVAVPVRRNDRNEVEALALDAPHGARIAGRLAELSAPFGAHVAADGDGGLLVRPGRQAASAA